MKQGKSSIAELGKELQRQREVRQDYIADVRQLELHSTSGLNSKLCLTINGSQEEFTVNETCHQQIAARLKIPFNYYKRLRSEYPDILDDNVNGLFSSMPQEKRMVRTMDGTARAFLSNRYRRIDNLEVCSVVLPTIQEMDGAYIAAAEVTENHLYIKVVNRRLKADVGVNDIVQAGMVISNSETGMGALRVEPLVYRLVCKNGLICKDLSQRRYHAGKQIYGDDEEAYELYSDETLAADDKAILLKIQDVVRTAVDETKFNMVVDKFRTAKLINLETDPVRSVELLGDKFLLTQPERAAVLRQFFLQADNSLSGLVNAVTASSTLSPNYERSIELERVGGELLEMGEKFLGSRKPVVVQTSNVIPFRPSTELEQLSA